MEGQRMATYRLTDNDIALMIKLRATNDAVFTGRRNSALRAWSAIKKEMGLQGYMTTARLKKKWENFKERYKEIKNSSAEPEKNGKPVWRWFPLMDQAMTGRLAGSANILNPSLFGMDDDEEPVPIKKLCVLPGVPQSNVFDTNIFKVEESGESRAISVMDGTADNIHTATLTCAQALSDDVITFVEKESLGADGGENSLLYATLMSTSSGNQEVNPTILVDGSSLPVVNLRRDMSAETAELEKQIAELERERRVLEREQAEFDQERLALEKERELLNREMASVERHRVELEIDRVAIDRERATLDRDRAVLERDRALMERERAELLREKEALMHRRLSQSSGCSSGELDPERLERRERLISLFEKLVEKL